MTIKTTIECDGFDCGNTLDVDECDTPDVSMRYGGGPCYCHGLAASKFLRNQEKLVAEQDGQHVGKGSGLSFLASELTRAFNLLGALVQEHKIDKGFDVTGPEAWEQKNQIPADLVLVHSEVSEALEAFRHADRGNFEEELADTVIRVVGLTYGMGIDLGSAIAVKMEQNRARPYRHGGKRL